MHTFIWDHHWKNYGPLNSFGCLSEFSEHNQFQQQITRNGLIFKEKGMEDKRRKGQWFHEEVIYDLPYFCSLLNA